MKRRAFLQDAMASVASYSFFQTAFLKNAFARAIHPAIERWVRSLHEMTREVRGGTISPRQWQEQIDTLHRSIDPADLLQSLDFEALARDLELPDRGVETKTVNWPTLEGLPQTLSFHGKVFGMRKDRAVVPHGHHNMASCHYVLHGDLHLRQYDKVEETESYMVIAPTKDEVVGPGTFSSISDDRDNIHWLRAVSATAYTYDVIALDIGGASWSVENIDPEAGDALSGGRIRAPKLDVSTALQKYGHQSHH